MNDEWDMPTGEYERLQCEPAKPRLRNDAGMAALGVTAGELRMVDAFLVEVAIDAAEDPRPPSAAEQLAVADLRVRAEHLKVMSPAELDAERERLRRLM
jgi:hypothetical protein